MRWREVVAAAALLWSGQSFAQDVKVGGFVFLEATHSEAKGTPVNPDDLFDLSSDNFEAALLFEGDAGGLSWRVRAEAVGDVADWPERKRLRIQELAYQWRAGERWAFSIGKQERSWDSGLAFRPLGFFRTRPDLRDITDQEGRQAGLPLVSATYIGDRFTAEAVVSDDVFGDVASDIEARQWAARISGQLGKLDASIVVRQAAGQRPGVGGSATYAAGAVELHADAYFGPRRRSRAHRGLVGNGEDVLGGLYPSDPFFLDRGGRGTVLNSVVGATWGPSRNFSLSAEYIHQGGGLLGRRWSAYLDFVARDRAALNTSAPGLAIANLAYDLGVLRGSVRKDYLFARAAGSWKGFGMSGTAFTGLADAGTILTGAISRRIGKKTDVSLTVTTFVGSSRSEFGLVPFGTISSLSLRRAF